MTIETNVGSGTVYEDADFEAVRLFREFQASGNTVLITFPCCITGVGAKGVVISTTDIYGGVVNLGIPIDEIRAIELLTDEEDDLALDADDGE